MCKSAEDFANTQAAQLFDINRLSKDLMQTSEDNRAYFEHMNCEMAKLKDELQIAKVDYFLIIKDRNEAQDKLVMLCNELESSKAILSAVKSMVVDRKAYDAKYFEEFMLVGRNYWKFI